MDDSGFTIGIVGGTGHMGQWFARLFESAGHRVVVTGRKTALQPKDLPDFCHAVFLSTPLEPAVEIAREIGPLLVETQLLSDFCSLKEEITRAMTEATRAEVVGTHPLFGPLETTLSGQNVVLCPGRGNTWLDRLDGFFTARGARVTRCAAREHDRNMAVVQGLNHFAGIALGLALERLGVNPADLEGFATPVFRLRMALVGRLFAQNLWLYRDLIQKNPHAPEVLTVFSRAVEEARDALAPGGAARADAMLGEIRKHLGGILEKSLEESGLCIGRLLEPRNDKQE
jgi:prephenate dehydrogenase